MGGTPLEEAEEEWDKSCWAESMGKVGRGSRVGGRGREKRQIAHGPARAERVLRLVMRTGCQKQAAIAAAVGTGRAGQIRQTLPLMLACSSAGGMNSSKLEERCLRGEASS